MKTAKALAFITMATIASIGCKKEKLEEPALKHNYLGKWANVSKTPEGPLDFYEIKLQLDYGSTGKSDLVYIEKNQSYPTTALSWQKGTGDSIIITLDIPAYPAETWELRGLANKTNSEFIANYYSMPKANLSVKKKYGTMVFKH
jgi:hypothetical protein